MLILEDYLFTSNIMHIIHLQLKLLVQFISIVFWISYIYTQRSTLSTKKQI